MTDRRPVLRLGHSPDPDDAFMWWPLFELNGDAPRLNTGRFRFEPVAADIERLNERSMTGELEITAISCAQYPHVCGRYALTACGASMGDAYGPKLVARRAMSLDDLRSEAIRLAVPGRRTSAFAAVSMMLGAGTFQWEPVPFDEIIPQIVAGEYEAGVIIHEGQLLYEQAGLHLVADLGHWWTQRTQLPLPLGVNAIRRDLEQIFGPGTLEEVTALLLGSVRYALEHRSESVEYALGFARNMPRELADQFIELYVNRWTLDFGTQGQEAVQAFLTSIADAGIAPRAAQIDFICPAPVACADHHAD